MPLIYYPEANSRNTAKSGNARFQVLTDRMIRMEWAEDGVFEDGATLAVVNRHTSNVAYKKEFTADGLVIRTKYLTLKYVNNGKRLSKDNLNVAFELDGKKVVWHPGKKDSRNLKGTARTLDEVDGDSCNLDNGLISRNGWAAVDDSTGLVLHEIESRRMWVVPRHKAKRQDIYLLAYGHDYKSALRDAALIFGRQPLPPRYVLGYWWSRYWAYTDREFEELVESFDRMHVPLDVLVVDMDWHLEGWTGYTWDRRYFPDPVEFLRWVKRRGLKVTLNLHPAGGVSKFEGQFRAMAKQLGIDAESVERVEFDCTDPDYMRAYFKHLHHPMERDGVDFWWIDWQQGRNTKLEGLDPLPWLNRLHWEDREKRWPGRRPLIMSRYGGLGSGRYPIGFSGDTHSTWESLAFQPYFTSTASNVLFGYWSHDIGGHQPGNIEPELYTRWVQFGAFAPIVRTHTTKNEKAERRVWEYPHDYSRIMINAIKRRYEMAPYIYSECRKCFDNGISLCRPMYYDYPDDDAAYKANDQYMFGDKMLVAPVTHPVDVDDEMAEMRIWLPEGEWFDTALGDFVKGPGWNKRKYLLSEIPVFVRPGAVIPGMGPAMRMPEGSFRSLLITMYPGDGGVYRLYEDDGVSDGYIDREYAIIPIFHELTQCGRKIVIEKSQDGYRGFKKMRSLEIRLPASAPPFDVDVEKKPLRRSFRLGQKGWTYDGDSMTTIIRIPAFDITQGIQLDVYKYLLTPPESVYGMKGLMARLERVRYWTTLATSPRITHPKERLAVDASQTGNRISRKPESFKTELTNLQSMLKELPDVLKEMRDMVKSEEKREYIERAINILKSMTR